MAYQNTIEVLTEGLTPEEIRYLTTHRRDLPSSCHKCQQRIRGKAVMIGEFRYGSHCAEVIRNRIRLRVELGHEELQSVQCINCDVEFQTANPLNCQQVVCCHCCSAGTLSVPCAVTHE